MSSIYKLINPLTDSVFYIGHTKGRIQDRLCAHICEAKSNLGRNREKDRLINSVLSAGQKPIVELIETVDEYNWEERESYHIDFFLKAGEILVNKASGGLSNKGWKHSEEALNKLKRKKTITKKFLDARQKVGIERRILTDEQIFKIRSQVGYKSQTQLASEFGVSKQVIYGVVKNRTYKQLVQNSNNK